MILRIVQKLLGMPRLVRILIAAVFAVAVTGALFRVVFAVYYQFFFSGDTVLVPGLVSASIGMVMYMVGWFLIVGTIGEPIQARMAILWYVGLGMLAVILFVIWILQGISIGIIAT